MKLGAGFVSDMRQETLHAKIVRSLIQMAQNLGLRVTADGVNDAETAKAWATLGCERIQGRHVGPLLSAQQVLACGIRPGEPARLPLAPQD